MSFIAILFWLELGMVPDRGVWMYVEQPTHVDTSDAYYTELDFELLLFDFLFVGSSIRTEIRPVALDSWKPYWTTYDFDAGVRFGVFELGWRHSCTHPIQTYVAVRASGIPWAEGSYDELYLRIGTQ